MNGVGVGYVAKQTAFAQRHSLFFERYPRLTKAINAAFGRSFTSTGIVDPIIFYLGSRSVDDFEAIVVLCANDLALPAQALIRGLYERVITAAHLHENPAEVTDFAEFDFVQRRRAAQVIRDVLGVQPEQEGALEELEREYQRVKSRFEIACDQCGKRRVGPSWSKLDFVTMAKRQAMLSELVVHAYYVPLQQAHSTLKSASALLERAADGTPAIRKGYTKLSDEILWLANVLILHALRIQNAHFKLPELDAALEVAMTDHVEIFGDDDETA